MLGEFYQWFIALPFYFQAVGYLLLLPFALMALGLVVVGFERSAARSYEGFNPFVGLIMLGALVVFLLGPAFGVIALCYYAVHLPYWLCVIIGFVTGPFLVIAILNLIFEGRP